MNIQDYFKNGKIFCGNRKCNLRCERNAVYVPYGIPFLLENYKPDKNGTCKYYEEIGGGENITCVIKKVTVC